MYSLFMPLTVKKGRQKWPHEIIFYAEASQEAQDEQKVFFSSNVLQSPVQMGDFAPRNGRGSAEEKRR